MTEVKFNRDVYWGWDPVAKKDHFFHDKNRPLQGVHVFYKRGVVQYVGDDYFDKLKTDGLDMTVLCHIDDKWMIRFGNLYRLFRDKKLASGARETKKVKHAIIVEAAKQVEKEMAG